jgi:hypothetical protein
MKLNYKNDWGTRAPRIDVEKALVRHVTSSGYIIKIIFS